MTDTAMEDFFCLYDNALSSEFCRDVVQRFESDQRKLRGRVGEGAYRPDFKGTMEIDFADIRQGWEDVINTLDQSLKFYLRHYMKTWGEAFKTVQVHHEGFRMARYNPGERFDWHSDNIGSSYTRVMTAMWYLNTVEEGGETDYKWMGRAIKPVEGLLMICPVGWPYFHRGAPPVSGPKYTIITQLHQQRLPATSGPAVKPAT
ncbi:MAG: 2OG-Fe(II) oxygenase [Lysobacterales bacterium]